MNKVKHLIYLRAIFVTSPCELSMSFVHFCIQFLFFPLSIKNSPYIGDISPLSVMYVGNIFSQFVTCLLTLVVVYSVR